jgi:hypothetical protein
MDLLHGGLSGIHKSLAVDIIMVFLPRLLSVAVLDVWILAPFLIKAMPTWNPNIRVLSLHFYSSASNYPVI